MNSAALWIASESPEVQASFIAGLPDNLAAALPYLFEFWALPHQVPPADTDWRTWVVMGGRGAGKTRAGAEWVRSLVEGPTPDAPGEVSRVALVGPTYEEAREVMVFGRSGVLACSPPDRVPEWQAGRRRLVWKNGAVAEVHSAHSPEHLRGPQFDAAWADELGKWEKPEEAWTQLQFALRTGEWPRAVVTTTPRNVETLKKLLRRKNTRVTHAPTEANAANLAKSFLEEVRAEHGGTSLGRQELDGVMVQDVDGALWTRAMIEAARGERPERLDRIVVAVDPSVTSGKASDGCGIVVAGVVEGEDGSRFCVLEDASLDKASPAEWARAALDAYHRHEADRIVAEANQGGDLIEEVLRQFDEGVPYSKVSATRAKQRRAEPVSARYERGEVVHVQPMPKLEDEMCRMTRSGYRGSGSPDRLDALVWAISGLVATKPKRPGVRPL